MSLESRREENPEEYKQPDERVTVKIGAQSKKYAKALGSHDDRVAVIYDDRVQLLAALHFIERHGLHTEFMQFARTVFKQTASARPPGPIPAPGDLPAVLPADEDG